MRIARLILSINPSSFWGAVHTREDCEAIIRIDEMKILINL